MMKNIVIIHIVLIILTNSSLGFSQDTINLISGKQIFAKVVEINFDKNGYISYDIKKKDKYKSKFVEKEDVFSISYYNSKKEVIYKTDSAKGFILNQDQMYNYVIGEQVAWNKHRTPKLVLTGGVISGMLAPFGGLYGLLIPVSYITLVDFVKPTIQYDNSKKPSEEDMAYYKLGYTGVAKSKNIKNNIIAGISGILASAVLITALQINSVSFKK